MKNRILAAGLLTAMLLPAAASGQMVLGQGGYVGTPGGGSLQSGEVGAAPGGGTVLSLGNGIYNYVPAPGPYPMGGSNYYTTPRHAMPGPGYPSPYGGYPPYGYPMPR